MDAWTTSKAFSHFFSFLPTLLPPPKHSIYLFPACLQSGCSKRQGGDGSPHAHAGAQGLTLCTCRLLQERPFETAAWLQGTQHGCFTPPVHVHTLQFTGSPPDQTYLCPLHPRLFRSHFRHEVGAKRPCTICWHQQAACKTLVQTSQSHHFNATVVVDRKEKGIEGSLCTDCSGIWS